MKLNVLLILFFKFQLLNRERKRERDGEKANGKTVSEEACEQGHHHLRRVVFRQLGFIKHGEFAWKLCYLQCLTHCLVSMAALWFKGANAELEVFRVLQSDLCFCSSPVFTFASSCFDEEKIILRRPPVETLKHMLNIRYTDTLLGGPSLQSEAVPPLSRCIFAAGLERERCEGDMTNELCSASLKKNVFVILVTEDERGRNQQWGSVI